MRLQRLVLFPAVLLGAALLACGDDGPEPLVRVTVPSEPSNGLYPFDEAVHLAKQKAGWDFALPSRYPGELRLAGIVVGDISPIKASAAQTVQLEVVSGGTTDEHGLVRDPDARVIILAAPQQDWKSSGLPPTKEVVDMDGVGIDVYIGDHPGVAGDPGKVFYIWFAGDVGYSASTVEDAIVSRDQVFALIRALHSD